MSEREQAEAVQAELHQAKQGHMEAEAAFRAKFDRRHIFRFKSSVLGGQGSKSITRLLAMNEARE